MNYQVLANRDSVEVWSAQRLPFEPKGWLRSLKNDINQAVRSLTWRLGFLLYGSYVSPDTRACDVENILFYNIGPGAFANAAKTAICFERAFSLPPLPPQPPNGTPLHYHRYALLPAPAAFNHWRRGPPLAAFTAPCPSLSSLIHPSTIWYQVKRGHLRASAMHEGRRFGVSVTIHTPSGRVTNLAALMKPVLDGVISAFHMHDGSSLDAIAPRLAQQINLANPSEVSHLLTDSTNAVLGQRRLLWPRREGIQWGPADDLCVVGELLLKKADLHQPWQLSGELFEVTPTHA